MLKKNYNIKKVMQKISVLTSITLVAPLPLKAETAHPALNVADIDAKRTMINLAGFEHVPPYSLTLHQPLLLSAIKNNYDLRDLNTLIEATQNALHIRKVTTASGVSIEAASFGFNSDEMSSETHYDASWVRDSLWGYFAFADQPGKGRDANQILLTLWDYFSSPKQLERINNVIKHPEIIDRADGQMLVPHIRYDNGSANFDDVVIGGKPQSWAHKQNDALGLFVDTILNSIAANKIDKAEWEKGKRLDAIIGLITYFDKVHYYNMPDSGMWEEDERINTSSVGLITSALENFYFIQQDDKHSSFIKALRERANTLNMLPYISQKNLHRLIGLGYKRINYQLEKGGESPDYSPNDSRYRTADAALLALIYPAHLRQLTFSQKEKVVALVASLEGNFGIRRYAKDSYQSSNYWAIDYNHVAENSSAEHYKSFRDNNFIQHSEAQWFFDSWLSKSYLQLFNESKNSHYYALAVRSMNRALSQLTGKNMVGANGKVVPAMSLPESYNIIYTEGKFTELPSPIVPLNWSKASVTLMFNEFQRILSEKK